MQGSSSFGQRPLVSDLITYYIHIHRLSATNPKHTLDFPVHKIDRQSPLYALSAQDMLKERFEIVVMLEGVVER